MWWKYGFKLAILSSRETLNQCTKIDNDEASSPISLKLFTVLFPFYIRSEKINCAKPIKKYWTTTGNCPRIPAAFSIFSLHLRSLPNPFQNSIRTFSANRTIFRSWTIFWKQRHRVRIFCWPGQQLAFL